MQRRRVRKVCLPLVCGLALLAATSAWGRIEVTDFSFDTQAIFADTIRVSSDQLMAVINDVLDFSKIEAGRLELEHVPFDLRDCVEGVMDMVAPRAVGKELELLFSVDPDVPATVRRDVVRLRQVLTNLLTESAKSSDIL